MFETTTPFTNPFGQKAGSSEAAHLRGFAWPELVARLAAARDVRNVLDKSSTGPSTRNGGSFVSSAGAVLGGQDNPGSPSERPINLVGLSGGKATPALCADAVSDAAHVDREAL